LALLTVSGMKGFHAAPSEESDPFNLLSWSWWTRPIERNAFLRLPGIAPTLYSVTFVSPTQGWAVGDDGTIVATDDGGKTWVAQTSGVTKTLDSVTFVSPMQGWAVGVDGTIVATDDGGKTWVAQTSKSTAQLLLHSVRFVNPTQGWAVGADGTVVATDDGGKTWTRRTSRLTETLNSVRFRRVLP
jgi:photosystem II stability/assembly factor-like uncharacterized protein